MMVRRIGNLKKELDILNISTIITHEISKDLQEFTFTVDNSSAGPAPTVPFLVHAKRPPPKLRVQQKSILMENWDTNQRITAFFIPHSRKRKNSKGAEEEEEDTGLKRRIWRKTFWNRSWDVKTEKHFLTYHHTP